VSIRLNRIFATVRFLSSHKFMHFMHSWFRIVRSGVRGENIQNSLGDTLYLMGLLTASSDQHAGPSVSRKSSSGYRNDPRVGLGSIWVTRDLSSEPRTDRVGGDVNERQLPKHRPIFETFVLSEFAVIYTANSSSSNFFSLRLGRVSCGLGGMLIYRAVQPPSTSRLVPVTMLAAGEAR